MVKQFSEDKVRVNDGFWLMLEKLGASRQAIAQHAQIPTSVLLNQATPTTQQFFSIWQSLPAITNNADIGFDFVKTIKVTRLPPELFAASLAKDYRSALLRVARFKRLCAPEIITVNESNGMAKISIEWLNHQRIPDSLVDTTLSFLLALGRDNSATKIEIAAIHLQRSPSNEWDLEQLYSAPIKFNCDHNAIVLKASELDTPLEGYNQALSDMLLPQLEQAITHQRQSQSYCEQVKWIIEQVLSAGSPTLNDVAKELGVSVRTLQRRITNEGHTFK
ncbi:AraC family transcriptional regulator ligand-binding domain-containing protein [Vibrio sp. LaRot3]|uniref:AraC family transcriptional regulator ligand-binding domain-containing protein n=1 Tax=Vibrio sp. LaRot3 TaxID=2998829 RepID=UPI0022CDD6B5|nr:AraC family transcriptional regulator ligand-binding domain-containing protein [Vibrio sp. LaRot3]MDA0149643.1 AraC family transcriptional regulator ligand-binding domain-containing protein [Vibrio sp. LaRot3]